MDTSRYLIALLPPHEIATEVTKIKIDLHDNFGLKQALKGPAHITLQMPFLLKEKKLEKLDQCLKNVASTCESFEIVLNGYGKFTSGTYFISVVENTLLRSMHTQLARELQLALGLVSGTYKNKTFSPHITVAYRDVKKRIMPKIDAYLLDRQYQNFFDLEELCLLEFINMEWELLKKYPIKKR